MENKTLLVEAINTPDFWLFASVFVAGTVTVAMRKRKEPINLFMFLSEIVLAFGLALLCWLAGLYQGLDSIQIALLALPSAYGQISFVSKLMQAKKHGIDVNGKA